MRAPDFWTSDGTAARLLDPIGRIYGLGSSLRRHWVTPKRADVPIICIGNLTVGGAGKTPTALAVIRHLHAQGHRVHALTRGYGGHERGPLRVDPTSHDAESVGDEPLLLARAAPTWVSTDRVAGAAAAVAAGASHIVMDDGLQNPHLAKDLALLVIDGGAGFGNRRLFPAGPLREPVVKALGRIDAAVLIGDDESHVLELLPDDLPILCAKLVPDGGFGHLAGRRVLAFCGIGRPEKFYSTLRDIGADLVKTRSFPDHHPYNPREIDELIGEARQFDAVCVTTEKDHVRLSPNLGKSVEKLTIRVAFQTPDELDRLLSTVIKGHAAAAK